MFNHTIKIAEKFLVDNTPTILTAVGAVGAVAASAFSWRAGYKTGRVLEATEASAVPGEKPLTTVEKVRLVGVDHIPAAGLLALSVGATVAANRVSVGRAAALGAAYALTNEKFGDYKDKVAEKFSKTKVDDIHTEIAQDGVKKNPPVDSQVIFVGSGEVMFKDSWSGRYFMSDMEAIRKAVNDANFEIRNGSYCSLTSFYHMIGLSATFDSDEIGWNDDSPLDVTFSTVLHEGKPVIVFDFDVIPIRGYYQGHS